MAEIASTLSSKRLSKEEQTVWHISRKSSPGTFNLIETFFEVFYVVVKRCKNEDAIITVEETKGVDNDCDNARGELKVERKDVCGKSILENVRSAKVAGCEEACWVLSLKSE